MKCSSNLAVISDARETPANISINIVLIGQKSENPGLSQFSCCMSWSDKTESLPYININTIIYYILVGSWEVKKGSTHSLLFYTFPDAERLRIYAGRD